MATSDSSPRLADADDTEFAVPIEHYNRAAVMPVVRRLSRVSNVRSVVLIAGQWAAIVAAMAGAVHFSTWWAYLLAALVIGSRQQALGILVHDAAHWLLFTNRTVNDLASDLFCAFPIGLSTTLYRKTHFDHHRYTSTAEDPDWVMQRADPDWHWPKTRREAWWLLVRSVLALNWPQSMRTAMTWSPAANLTRRPVDRSFPWSARCLFVAGTIVLYALIGWGIYQSPRFALTLIALWVAPFLLIFNFLSRIRATAEHIATPAGHELNSTRTILAPWWERWLIAPLGINYHLEHHLFPSVPGSRLRELHAALMADDDFRARAHLTRGYLTPGGLVSELVKN